MAAGLWNGFPCLPKSGSALSSPVARPKAQSVPAAPRPSAKPGSAEPEKEDSLKQLPDEAFTQDHEPLKDDSLREPTGEAFTQDHEQVKDESLRELALHEPEQEDSFKELAGDACTEDHENDIKRISSIHGTETLSHSECMETYDKQKEESEKQNAEKPPKELVPPVDPDQTQNAGCFQLRPAAPDGGIEPERKDADDMFLENMFSRFDIDDDGYITKEEMTEKNEIMVMFDMYSESRAVDEGSVQEKVEAYFREMDTDGDGFINLEEFIKYFKPKLPEP